MWRNTNPTGRNPLREHRTFFVSRTVDALPPIAQINASFPWGFILLAD
jgi:hypothetical protein